MCELFALRSPFCQATGLLIEVNVDVILPFAPWSRFPDASMKLVCADRPEVWPVAVSVNVTPTSAEFGTKLVLTKFPFASATAVYGPCVSMSGLSTSVNATVSPGK